MIVKRNETWYYLASFSGNPSPFKTCGLVTDQYAYIDSKLMTYSEAIAKYKGL